MREITSRRTGALVVLLLSAGAIAEQPKLTLEQVKSHRMLLEAIVKQDLAATKTALDGGADPNLNLGGRTPLETAAIVGHVEIVKLLVERGADPATRNKDGQFVYDWSLKLGDGDPMSVSTQIGAYLKAKSQGEDEPEAPKLTDEQIADAKFDDGVVVLPEVALKATPSEKPDLSAFNNVPVPAGWTAFRAEKEKAWILSNGQTGEKAARIILADPQAAPESLNRVRDDLENGLRGYANICGVPSLNDFDLTTSIRTAPDRTLSVSASAMGMEQSKVVASFDLYGEIRDKKMFAVMLHRGPDDSTLPALSMFFDFRQKALRSPD